MQIDQRPPCCEGKAAIYECICHCHRREKPRILSLQRERDKYKAQHEELLSALKQMTIYVLPSDAWAIARKAIDKAEGAMDAADQPEGPPHRLRWTPTIFGRTKAHCCCGADCPETYPEDIQRWFSSHVAQEGQ